MITKHWLACVGFLIFTAGNVTTCIKTNPKLTALPPDNVGIYDKPFAMLWDVAIKSIQFEFLIPLELIDQNQGFFSSELMEEEQENPKTRYRLSGTVKFNGEQTVVKLYKHEQIFDNALSRWKTIPSDQLLERRILDRIRKRL